MNGVLYYASGTRVIEPLAVSLWSLRRHYRGAVAIAHAEDLNHTIPILSSIFHAQHFTMPSERPLLDASETDKRTIVRILSNKCAANLYTPFQRTIRLDADTLIEAPIDELFRHTIAFTRLGDDNQSRRLLDPHVYQSGRVRMYYTRLQSRHPTLRGLVDSVMQWNPYITNTGVYVMPSPEHPFASHWAYLSLLASPCCIHEEVTSLLACLPWKDEVSFISNEWNAYRKTCVNWTHPKKIRHFADHTYGQSKTWRDARDAMYQELSLRKPLG